MSRIVQVNQGFQESWDWKDGEWETRESRIAEIPKFDQWEQGTDCSSQEHPYQQRRGVPSTYNPDEGVIAALQKG